MSDRLSETRASLIISSDVVSGHRVAEDPRAPTFQRLFVKGTPTGQTDFPEHPFNIAMFASPLAFEERLENHLGAILAICEQREDKLLSLKEYCKINVHCTYLIHSEGGWTLTQDLCRKMGSLPLSMLLPFSPKLGEGCVRRATDLPAPIRTGKDWCCRWVSRHVIGQLAIARSMVAFLKRRNAASSFW